MKPTNHPMFQKPLQFTLLADARTYVVDHADQVVKGAPGKGRRGVPCPCCGRMAACYPRKLNYKMALGLMFLVNRSAATNGNWVHMPTEAPRDIVKTNEYATLEHWELIVQKPNVNDPTKRCSGMWKPTDLGIAFVFKKATVSRIAHIYAERLQGYSGGQVDIVAALGDYSDYDEMMQKLR